MFTYFFFKKTIYLLDVGEDDAYFILLLWHIWEFCNRKIFCGENISVEIWWQRLFKLLFESIPLDCLCVNDKLSSEGYVVSKLWCDLVRWGRGWWTGLGAEESYWICYRGQVVNLLCVFLGQRCWRCKQFGLGYWLFTSWRCHRWWWSQIVWRQ